MNNSLTTSDQALKPYQKIHELTGDVVDKYKYLEGHPKQYRCDLKEGVFNINGDEKLGRVFTFRPLAWRLFWDPNLFNMGPKDWAEIFFIDEQNVVSAVLFHGYSVTNLNSLLGPLHFDDLMLSDVILTITAEKKQRQIDNGTYYIANFEYKGAPLMPEDVEAFLIDTPIYRDETLSESSDVKTHHGMKFVVRPHAATEDDSEKLPWEERPTLAQPTDK